MFFLLSVVSLVWRQGSIYTGSVKISELLVFFTLAFILSCILFSKENVSFLKVLVKKYIPYFFLIFFFAFIGNIFSSFEFSGIAFYKVNIILDYLRMFFVFLFFFLTLYVIIKSPEIIKHILIGIAISPLIFWLAIFPKFQSFFLNSGRLRGAENDANYFATWIVLGIIISLFFAFFYNNQKIRWPWIINLFFVFPLLLWTGSRGAWVSVFLSISLLFFLYFFKRENFLVFVKRCLLVISIFIFSAFFTFYILPHESRVMLLYRTVYPLINNSAFSREVENQNSFLSLNSKEMKFEPKLFAFGQDRQDLWVSALYGFITHPTGYGFSYSNWKPLAVLIGDIKQGSHNLFLEIGLTFGWGGLIVFLLFYMSIIKKSFGLIRKHKEFPYGIVLFVLLSSLFISSLFLDTITLRWMWFIFGAIVSYDFVLNKNEKLNV